MEAIVVIGLLVGLAVAAVLWGRDSRPRYQTKESEQALWGLSWADQPPLVPVGPHARPERSALATALRARRAAAAQERRRAA
jgi:hypothetical protein